MAHRKALRDVYSEAVATLTADRDQALAFHAQACEAARTLTAERDHARESAARYHSGMMQAQTERDAARDMLRTLVSAVDAYGALDSEDCLSAEFDALLKAAKAAREVAK